MEGGNHLKNILDRGEQAWGVWQTLPGSNLSRMLARSGVDWVLIDCEHGNIDDAAMHESVAAIAACGISPIVRIPDISGWHVKRALDTGAHAILVPLLQSPADATAIVSAAKFPPLGVRGFGSPFAHTNFSRGVDATSYLRTANDNLLTIVQIETREALATVEQIAATPGIDMLFVGPFDLGNALGDPMIDGVLSQGLETAIEKIIKAARAEGKKLGIYAPTGEMANKCRVLGFDLISVTADSISIGAWIERELIVARGGNDNIIRKPSGPYSK